MHLLNGIASNFIGLLLLALSGTGGSVAISSTSGSASTSTTATSSTIVITDHSILEGLRSALVHMQENLNAKEGRKDSHRSGELEPGDDRTASTTIEDNSNSNRTSAEHESIRPGSRGEDSDREDEDEQEDERESEHGGKSGSGAAVRTLTTPATPPATVSVPAPTQSGITMATVAEHNTKASCYTAISGSVYDVTAWISQHPGGASAIIGLCGKDGTAAFSGQHGGQGRPASELAAFKIGALAN